MDGTQKQKKIGMENRRRRLVGAPVRGSGRVGYPCNSRGTADLFPGMLGKGGEHTAQQGLHLFSVRYGVMFTSQCTLNKGGGFPFCVFLSTDRHFVRKSTNFFFIFDST